MSNVVSISIAVSDHISAAFYQNEVPVISELAITNSSDEALSNAEILIECEPVFAAPLRVRIDTIAPGGTRHVAPINLRLDPAFLRTLKEATRGHVSATFACDGKIVSAVSSNVLVLPASHWGGTGSAPELLGAFVRPNDPAIETILHEASARLASAGRKSQIDGYLSGGRERAWELGNAIWSAIASHGIAYVLPPASFERSGQKVRGPGDILSRKTGTCLDLALLYAACLEQAGLNAVAVLTEGHAFVGLWLQTDDFPSVAVDDMQMLRKRRDLEEIVFIETTFLTHSPPGSFSSAVKQGAILVEEDAPPLEVAIDIKRARARHIKPLDIGESDAGQIRPNLERQRVELEIEAPPAFLTEMEVKHDKEVELTRLEQWKRKLLDLSLRNKMLNFKDGRKAVGIECPEPALLEDMLSNGGRFKLVARSNVLAEGGSRDKDLFLERHHDDGRRSYLLHALQGHELHTTLSQADLDNRLTDLFRVTRTAFEEGGSNILFLAVGFLKWTQKENGPVIRAPLLLVPVSLQRTSIRAGFRLALHDDDVRFNPTLLQMLRQDFNLHMHELNGDLPTDQSGIDVERILRSVRSHVKEMRGWEVTNEVILSTFSFTKFLMWRDLVERTELLKRNPVVRHLIDTPKQQYEDGISFPSPQRLDYDYHPQDIFAPLPADSSQLAAVLAAASGKSFVLKGPPGTGKSQTIANIISHCLALGKTVLFVSQKTAALEVVQRRLRDIGLGEYCLEVHSTKAQKSAVLGQLKQAWHERSMPAAEDWQGATAELAQLRDELNNLVSALHRRRSNGMSAFSAFGIVAANRDRFAELKLDWPMAEHSEDEISEFRRMCRNLQPILRSIGDPATHPLRSLPLQTWNPFWRAKVEPAINAVLTSISSVSDTLGALATVSGLSAPSTYAGCCRLSEFIGQMCNEKGRSGYYFIAPDAGDTLHIISRFRDQLRAYDAATAQLASEYRMGVYALDLDHLLSEWIDATQSNFLVRGSRQKKVAAELSPYAKTSLPSDLSQELAALIEVRKIVTAIEKFEPQMQMFPGLWAGVDTDLDTLTDDLDWAARTRELANEMTDDVGVDRSTLIAYAVQLQSDYQDLLSSGGAIAQCHAALEAALFRCQSAFSELNELIGASSDHPISTGMNWIEQNIETLERWKSGLDLAQPWAQWIAERCNAVNAGLKVIVTAVESGNVHADEIEQAFEVAHARWWSEIVVSIDPTLASFLAARHEDTIARFRASDERVTELAQRIVRARLSGSIPPPTAFGNSAEWGTLARELHRKARQQPLRQLFSNIPTVLTQLTPCVMMSPLSIAQYLPPDAKPFDLVIFDEASQIPVWDAIGAIARGNQVVIVGDPEQLPPTSVGERGVDYVDDGTDVEDQESILDESLASNVPPHQLDWHYRSRHESLIAFSNQSYYQGRLVTFPSPLTDDVAVRHIHVPNGVYERGAGRVNRIEAQTVVEEVVRRLRDPGYERSRLSLGIVTFNGEQMRLIENMLDQARRSYPEIEKFFSAAEWFEPVFVKNLENVQGDERDTIFFSVAVGPDQTGRVFTTISSLNKDGGHRRLNVAITRARREMIVFSTLRPEQIDLSRSRARGVRDFKHFLEFAQRGPRALVEAFAPTGGETESPFEDAIKWGLESRGWVVHPQIGVSKFRIDLGVVDPDEPGRYLAGIECDGATYHRSDTARDRDRLRESVLRKLGWNIHRVWSTDWWMNADKALDRLDSALQEDLDAIQKGRQARTSELEGNVSTDAPKSEDASSEILEECTSPTEEMQFEQAESTTEKQQTIEAVGQGSEPPRQYAYQVANQEIPLPLSSRTFAEYRLADFKELDFPPDSTKFHDPGYRPKIRAMATLVLSAEAPIYEDLLVQRISRAHNFSRAGGNIRDTIVMSIRSIAKIEIDDGRRLLWPNVSKEERGELEFRRAPQDVRSHSDTPICELSVLARAYIDEGGDREEVVRRMAAVFDLGRLRASTQERLSRAYDLAL